ncbi:MAG: hypothetical protein LKKZDAJK_000653 [Candidatus Fervidibacter sp.]
MTDFNHRFRASQGRKVAVESLLSEVRDDGGQQS